MIPVVNEFQFCSESAAYSVHCLGFGTTFNLLVSTIPPLFKPSYQAAPGTG
jgi:hypothetical protein